MLEEIVLHIGCEKTGTTSIQRFLAEHREPLRRTGVLYPTTPGLQNHVVLTLLFQKQGVDDLRDLYASSLSQVPVFDRLFSQELAAHPSQRVILSNEHCSSRMTSDEPLIALKAFLNRFCPNVRIVVYVRRQDKALLSEYSMALKAGATRAFAIPSDAPQLDYKPILDRWARVFGARNIMLRVFREPEDQPFDVVADFLDTVAIDTSLRPTQRLAENRSLDAKTSEFLRLFNAFVPAVTDGRYDLSRFEIMPFLETISTGEAPIYDPDGLAQFYRRFSDSNAYVARVYAHRDDGRLFDPPDVPCSSAKQEFSAHDAVEIAAKRWRALAAGDFSHDRS